MNSKPNPGQILRQLPTKWAVGIVVLIIGYTLIQPFVNSRFGWNLPSVASLSAEEGGANHQGQDADGRDTSDFDKFEKTSQSVAVGNSNQRTDSSGSSGNGNSATYKQDFENRRESEPRSNPDPPSDLDSSDLKYGLLKDLGREEYMSPGGLRYTRGSAEGHRLKHIERHLEDQPNRPGSHGVFYGDMAQVIRWLDDAHDRALAGARGTSKKQEDRRTVIEAGFDKPVGFVGGQTGKRKGNPDAKRIRLVVEGDRVITAFPF